MGILQAAALALILAGVAGAAIPGSPLRMWLESTFGEDEVAIPEIVVSAPQPVTPVPAQPAPAERTTNEVTAIPVDGRVVIALHEPPAGVQLVVRLSDQQNASVDAAAEPTASPGSVDLRSIGGNRIVVTLPRSIVSARITVDGELLVHREGESYTTLPPEHTERGEEIVVTLRR